MLLPLLALMALAACDRADNASGPGGVSVGEARALDEAAEMIDARRMPKELLRPGEVLHATATPTAPATLTPNVPSASAAATGSNPATPVPARP